MDNDRVQEEAFNYIPPAGGIDVTGLGGPYEPPTQPEWELGQGKGGAAAIPDTRPHGGGNGSRSGGS